jgi:hypothetical protein
MLRRSLEFLPSPLCLSRDLRSLMLSLMDIEHFSCSLFSWLGYAFDLLGRVLQRILRMDCGHGN